MAAQSSGVRSRQNAPASGPSGPSATGPTGRSIASPRLQWAHDLTSIRPSSFLNKVNRCRARGSNRTELVRYLLILFGRLDLDQLGFRLRDSGLWHRDCEDALRHARANSLGFHAVGKLERARERSIATFNEIAILPLLLSLSLLFTADRQDVVRELDLDVLLLEARKLDGDCDIVLTFCNVEFEASCRNRAGRASLA